MDLENHLDFLPQRGEFRRIKLGQVLALENNLALGGFFQLKDTTSGGGLATAGFSHPQGFTSFDAEVDAIHRFDQRNILIEEKSFRNREVHLQTLDFKEIFCGWIGNGFPYSLMLQNLFLQRCSWISLSRSQQAVICPLATCSKAG